MFRLKFIPKRSKSRFNGKPLNLPPLLSLLKDMQSFGIAKVAEMVEQ
jgi:hypothetical protein